MSDKWYEEGKALLSMGAKMVDAGTLCKALHTVDVLRVDNESLRNALNRYGRHDEDCVQGGQECSCGLVEANQ